MTTKGGKNFDAGGADRDAGKVQPSGDSTNQAHSEAYEKSGLSGLEARIAQYNLNVNAFQASLGSVFSAIQANNEHHATNPEMQIKFGDVVAVASHDIHPLFGELAKGKITPEEVSKLFNQYAPRDKT